LVRCHGVTKRLLLSDLCGVDRLSWGWLFLWVGRGAGVGSGGGVGGGLVLVGSAVAECLKDVGVVLVGGGMGYRGSC
jgi:hypothetical protein